jgi:hypothetical protein
MTMAREDAMAADQWWYSTGDRKHGPVSASQLRGLAAERKLGPDDLIWRAGMKDWVPARSAKNLFPAAPEPPPLPASEGEATAGAGDVQAEGEPPAGTFYPGWGKRAGELCDVLKKKFARKGYETQVLTVDQDGRIFQMRTGYTSKWKKVLSEVTGLANAATVTMKPEGDGLRVTVGGGKWLEKAAVAGVATYLSLGLVLIPAGVGAWKQKQLLESVSEVIDRQVHPR